MSIVEAVQSVFNNYANFNGRARRSEYWWFFLVNFIITGVLDRLGKYIGLFDILSTVYTLAVLIPGLAVAIRRLHDIGKRWPWILFALIPIVGWIFLVVWYCQDSQPGSNEFGPNPKGM